MYSVFEAERHTNSLYAPNILKFYFHYKIKTRECKIKVYQNCSIEKNKLTSFGFDLFFLLLDLDLDFDLDFDRDLSFSTLVIFLSCTTLLFSRITCPTIYENYQKSQRILII